LLSTEDHTLVMGIVNTTPDSFSDGGLYDANRDAIAHGLYLWDQGADIVDVGGESTRPGAVPVPVDDEIERVVPVVAGLAARGVVVSIDTMKAPVASAAIAAGAHIVNDITALGDPEMTAVCAESGVGVVLMHMQGTPQTMQENPSYENVVAEVRDYLVKRARYAIENGIGVENIVVDPGIGFGKEFHHNLDLLDGIERLADTGFPVLIGTSRKGFLGLIMHAAGFEVVAADRDAATASTVALAIARGAAIVRVHNVSHGVQAARTADAIVRAPLRR
jgi:dihydropteroate synthase